MVVSSGELVDRKECLCRVPRSRHLIARKACSHPGGLHTSGQNRRGGKLNVLPCHRAGECATRLKAHEKSTLKSLTSSNAWVFVAHVLPCAAGTPSIVVGEGCCLALATHYVSPCALHS
eukprot:2701220-Amphidinium_carterae.1